jgi:hypothetical protein
MLCNGPLSTQRTIGKDTMKFAVLSHIFLASLIGFVLGIVGVILSMAYTPPSYLTPAQYLALPPSLRNVAVIGRALNTPTNAWNTVGLIAVYLLVFAPLVAIVTGIWLNKLYKGGARPSQLFHFREKPNIQGVAMMNRINKRPGGGGHPGYSNFADGE